MNGRKYFLDSERKFINRSSLIKNQACSGFVNTADALKEKSFIEQRDASLT